MAAETRTLTWTGEAVTASLNKDENRYTGKLDKTSGKVQGTIQKVSGKFNFSTNNAGVTYTVVATLCDKEQKKIEGLSSTMEIDHEVDEATGKQVEFTFSGAAVTPDNLNKVEYIHFTSSTNTTSSSGKSALIYIKGTQTLTIQYSFNPVHTISYHNGTEWVQCEVYYHDGTNWVLCDPYYHDGTDWVLVDTQ